MEEGGEACQPGHGVDAWLVELVVELGVELVELDVELDVELGVECACVGPAKTFWQLGI